MNEKSGLQESEIAFQIRRLKNNHLVVENQPPFCDSRGFIPETPFEYFLRLVTIAADFFSPRFLPGKAFMYFEPLLLTGQIAFTKGSILFLSCLITNGGLGFDRELISS